MLQNSKILFQGLKTKILMAFLVPLCRSNLTQKKLKLDRYLQGYEFISPIKYFNYSYQQETVLSLKIVFVKTALTRTLFR